MDSYRELRVFISSRMDELASERRTVEQALGEINIKAWKFETHAGARPQSIQETFLGELEAADLYLGIFWKGYGAHTIQEYEKAREIKIPCFVYEKRTELEERDPQLQVFLDRLSSVDQGVTIQWFSTTDELESFVKRDITSWLTSSSRKGRQAERKSEQIRQRKHIRNRSIALVGMVFLLVLFFGFWVNWSNGQHCKRDLSIIQDGKVHIFETHYDNDEIRWWLQQPAGFFSIGASSAPEFPLKEKDAKFILTVRYDQARNYIWVGTSGRGLMRLSRSDGKWVFDKKFDLTSNLDSCQIQTILMSGHRIYLGSVDVQVPVLSFSYDGETWQQTPSLPVDEGSKLLYSFRSLANQETGIWAGTSRGLYFFDGEDWLRKPFTPDWLDEQQHLDIRDVAVGWMDIKWIATKGQGLLLLENNNGKTNWDRPLFDHGVETVYAFDLFSSGKQALVGTNQGLFICSITGTEPVSADCEMSNHEDTNQKPVYSLLLAPDDSQVFLGTDAEEYKSIP